MPTHILIYIKINCKLKGKRDVRDLVYIGTQYTHTRFGRSLLDLLLRPDEKMEKDKL